MKKQALRFALIFAFMSGATRAQAVLPTGWASARALGMGNAYTAVVTDSDAILYNPAAAARASGIHWTIMDPHVGASPANATLASEFGNFTSKPAATMNKLYGKNIWAGGGGKSAIMLPYFGVAAYANTEAGAMATNPANPRMNLNYYFDYGGAVTIAADFIPGFFALGTTVRYVNRTGTTNSIGPSTLANLNQTQLEAEMKRRGTGYGVDFGAVFRVPGPISPSASFVYRDAGQTMFSAQEGAGAPPPVNSEMIAGVGVTMNLLLISITPAVDFRYIGWTGVPTGQNINAGLEISLPLINLRGGVSQGYYTAGVGVDLLFLRADVATWAVEMGNYSGQAPDRRYMAELTLEFGFDPSKFLAGFGGKGGSGGGGGGDGRRLKRRR